MSSENDEAIAGHLPAGEHFDYFIFFIFFSPFSFFYLLCFFPPYIFIPVKVGGMRVASKPKHHEQDADAYDEKYEESLPE